MDIIQVSKARKEILKEPTHVLKGVISSSIPNVLSVPFRLHFEVPDAEVVEDEIKKEEKEVNSSIIDCTLVVHDVDVRPYVSMYIINEDDGTEEMVPLHAFENKKFVKNSKGYTVMATMLSKTVELPSTPFTLSVVSNAPLKNVLKHTMDSTQIFKGRYIRKFTPSPPPPHLPPAFF
jgi:hypothetical protein